MHQFAFVSGMSGFPWGGSEELWSQAAVALHEAGHRVFASVHGWPETPLPVKRLRWRGIVVQERRIRQSVGSRLLRRCGSLLGQPGQTVKERQMSVFLDIASPGLACISHGGIACGLEWMELCALRGIPYVSICQANGENMWPQAAQAERLGRAYIAARASFFVSEANKELFEEQIGQRLSNAEVVRDPFNVPYETDIPWPPSNDGIRLACVARLDPRAKGQDLLFKVLATDKWRGRPIALSLFGAGPCEGNLKALVRMHALASKVTFHGHVADVREIWRHHHALILPSRFEGLPLAIVEAMLCGRPCIVTDVAGNAELLEDNVSGFIAAAPTANLVDDALERAWNRRNEWPQIAARAQAAVRHAVPPEPARTFAEKLLQITSC